MAVKLAFDADIEISCWSHYHERPVVDGDRVLCAGGGEAREAVCVLAACDRESGVARAMAFVDDVPAGREVSTGLPAALGDRRSAICVYAKDQYLRLLVLDPQMRVEHAVDVDGDSEDLRIFEHDAASKLWLGPLFVDDGGFLFSWLYRQVRFFHTERRAPDLRRAWSAPEWCHGVTAGVVVGETPPSADRRLCGRDLETGRLLWEWPLSRIVMRDAQGRDVDVASEHVAAVGCGRVYLVDRTARAEENEARFERMVLELSQSNEADEAAFLAENPLVATTTLSAVDVRSGEAWRATLPGDIVSLHVGPPALVVTAGEDGAAVLTRHDEHGAVVARRAFRGPAATQWPPTADAWPAALAPDLLGRTGALVALGDDLAERARLELDVMPGHRARVADRTLNEWRAAIDGDDVFLREGARLIGVRR